MTTIPASSASGAKEHSKHAPGASSDSSEDGNARLKDVSSGSKEESAHAKDAKNTEKLRMRLECAGCGAATDEEIELLALDVYDYIAQFSTDIIESYTPDI